MRRVQDNILLSASDLMRFMGCTHATSLDLAYLRGDSLQPREDSEDAALLQRQGDAHEAAHLARLTALGRSVFEIKRDQLATNAEETRAALKSGADVIFQGAFLSGNWGGWSDFLERVEKPSLLGNFSYEVTDTKLKRKVHPKHVLQLVLYSDLLTEIQGVSPEFAHVELGNGERTTLRLSDYASYARLARARLEIFIASPDPTQPIPCSDCGLCRWQDHCDAMWMREDSLFTVANITKGQVKKLETAGVTTLEALANSTETIRGITSPTLDKLRAQARLQQARKTGEPTYQLRPGQPGKGFDLLPEPQKGDLFYDIEGDPHYEGGLEYLHGIWFDGKFKAFWGHDHDAEAHALTELLEFFRSRIEQYPSARIYHYAPYEITALGRLTAKYGIGEAFFDRLLRERRFTDLFAVVRGGILVSEPNYSIKSLETFYGLKRSGEVKTAGGSIVAYEKWRETQDQQILDEIEDYNRIDCQSTEMLRDWLVSIRPDGPWFPLAEDKRDKEVIEDQEAQALHEKLAASNLSKDRQDLLFNLGFFHYREKKPAYWAIYQSIGKDEDELIDDFNALAGLEAMTPAFPIKRSMCRTYRFPDQETKLKAGEDPTTPFGSSFASVTIEKFDLEKNLISVKVGNNRSEILGNNLTLHPGAPLNTDGIAAAVMDVINDQCGEKRYHAVNDLLTRAMPKLQGHSGVIIKSEDLLSETIDAIHRMQQTVLPIQG
ncbi:MAG: TM0106 family RecB-like putative nuclease, partial [Methylocystaceae bacterium]|nr:TM0106 family RecB-like putative nuclease [Methylocystaceae bacterium]